MGEESFIDTMEKIITLYTRSVGFGAFMTATEKVVYQADPDNPDHTVALKQAWVESNFYGLRSAIKSFGIERFKVNCVKATEGFNFVLERFHLQQNSLREMGQVKLAEFQQRRDNLKIQYNEKVEQIRDKTSAQWTHAKEAAKTAKETARESALKTKIKTAEMMKASTAVYAEEK